VTLTLDLKASTYPGVNDHMVTDIQLFKYICTVVCLLGLTFIVTLDTNCGLRIFEEEHIDVLLSQTVER